MTVIEVSFFGPTQDLAGVAQASIELPEGATIDTLRDALVGRFPALTKLLPAVRFARNESFVNDDEPLASGDRVALIPPVSGGEESDCLWVDVLDGALPIDKVMAFVKGDAGSGGVVTFEGVTRREVDDEHGALVRLDYEAYDAMARQELRRLGEQAMDRWSLKKMAVVHRVGRVPVGEASVVIAVAGAHRAECFDACRWAIDTLKRDVPIWKKDVFMDGFVRWVDPTG